jgi:hypothetical protein
MDPALIEFRKAAARENRGRRGLQRRYSPALQTQAVAYWRIRQRHGDRLRVVAAALGVAHWSLHRWITASNGHARFHPVQIVTSEPSRRRARSSSSFRASAPASSASTSRPPRSCWRCCDEMGRTARRGVRVHAADGYAERV